MNGPMSLEWALEQVREIALAVPGRPGFVSGIVAAAAMTHGEAELAMLALGRKHGWPREPDAENLLAWAQDLGNYLQTSPSPFLRPELRELAELLQRVLERAAVEAAH